MGFFGSNFKGENKWFTIYTMTLYVFVFSFAIVPSAFWYIIIIVFAFYTISYGFLRYRIRMGKFESIAGIKFVEAKLIMNRAHRQEMMLGIEKIDEMKLDGTFRLKSGAVLRMEDMEEYAITRETIIEELEEANHPLVSKVEFNEDGTIKEVNEPTLSDFESDNFINEPELFRNTIKRKLFIEKMGELKAYWVKMYEPKAFSDSPKNEFSNFILVCYGDVEGQFNFQKELLNVKGYLVKGLTSSGTFIVLDWLGIDLPLIFLRFSENEAFKMTNHTLEAQKIVLLKFKVMERMIYDYRSFFSRFRKQLDEEKSLSASFRNKADLTFQMMNHIAGTSIGDGEQIRVPKKKIELSYFWFVLILLGWIAFIITLFMYLDVIGIFVKGV